MEYSFIHFSGTLWTANGARKADGTLWHAELPMHPRQPDIAVPIETADGTTTSVAALDLASVLLLQQPKELSVDASGPNSESDIDELLESEGDASPTERATKWRPLGSVAALTTGLRSKLESEDTQERIRQALESLVQSFDAGHWVAIDELPSHPRPWTVRAVDPPKNFNQKPKSYARHDAAQRNAALLEAELRIAHAALALRLPRLGVRQRLRAERPVTVLEILRLAEALAVAPTQLITK